MASSSEPTAAMGVRHFIQRVPSEALDLVRSHPEVLDLLAEAGAYSVRDLAAMEKRGDTGESFSVAAVSAMLATPLRSRWAKLRDRVEWLELDKAGPAVHFLLAGHWDTSTVTIASLAPNHVTLPWQASLVSPVLVPPADLAAIANSLYKLRESLEKEGSLRDALERLAAKGIYPEIWNDTTAAGYLREHVRGLYSIAMRTAHKGDAVVVLTEV